MILIVDLASAFVTTSTFILPCRIATSCIILTRPILADINGEAEEIWQKARKKLSNRYKTFYRTIKNWD
jgi:hypothetical protein